ncbi:hypothetical protein Natoc_2936 [Natronococcus occultus SP4]|uniref:DUF8119 domain-containing protein n=2 Tax=Natronococcus occultus TaxID=29288 RepID=L0K067_9EURY|nr:hypothetical protein Natoc_2936 [Natronococcus occultus SP4]
MDRSDRRESFENQPLLESRRERLAAYLRFNRDSILVDVLLISAWILLASGVAQWFGLPRWFFYTVVFVGIVVYTQTTSPWSRPYRSPD